MIYTDIAEIELDQWNGQDGDNSLLVDGKPLTNEDWNSGAIDALVRNEIRTLTGAASAAPRYVPFKRKLKLGSLGKDSFAVKRALSSAGFGPWGGWGSQPRLFGPYAVRNLKAFQKKNRLPQTGIYDLATHKKLAPFFDSYGGWLVGQTKVTPLDPNKAKREAIVATAMLGYNHRYSIHYTQGALRMQGVRQRIKPPSYPRYEDCSSFATWCYWVARMNDPNGLGYNGFGYTGTLARHGKAISYPYAKPGDLIFYGRFPHSHVTIYVGHGRCVSHGSENGPFFLPYNYRTVNSIRSYF